MCLPVVWLPVCLLFFVLFLLAGFSPLCLLCLVVVVGPTEESAVWIDEPDLIEGKDKLHLQKPRDPLGYDHVLYALLALSAVLIAHETCFRFREIPSTEDELEELYPDGTGELTSENFIAAWYLLEYHRNTRWSFMFYFMSVFVSPCI